MGVRGNGMEMKDVKWHNKCENEVEQTKRQERKKGKTEPNRTKPNVTKPNHCNAMKESQETRAENSFALTHIQSANTKHISRLRPTTISNTYERNIPFQMCFIFLSNLKHVEI